MCGTTLLANSIRRMSDRDDYDRIALAPSAEKFQIKPISVGPISKKHAQHGDTRPFV